MARCTRHSPFTRFLPGWLMSAPLDDLVARHHGDLVRFLRRRVRSREAVEDLAQETYLRLARMADRDAIRDPSSYLFGTAAQLAIDHLRRSERATAMGRLSKAALAIADPAPSPEECACAAEALGILEDAISALDPLARRVLIASRFQGHSHARIARDLGISISWVEKNVIRALAHLKRHLRERGA